MVSLAMWYELDNTDWLYEPISSKLSVKYSL